MRRRNIMIMVAMAGLTAAMAVLPGMAETTRMGQEGAVETTVHNPVADGYLTADFEDGYQPFAGRSGKVWSLATEGSDPNQVLLISGHTDVWDGPSVEVTDWMKPFGRYTFSGYFKQVTGSDQRLDFSFELHKDGKTEYRNAGAKVDIPSNLWKKIEFTFTAPEDGFDTMKFYIQSGKDEAFDFMMDEISIRQEEDVSNRYQAALDAYSLKDTFQDDFLFGAALLVPELKNEGIAEVVRHHYGSITFGNEFKPDNILNREASQASADGSPEIHYDRIDEMLQLAQKNGLKVRGHVLVWHSQTPDWFFRVGYNPDGEYVDAATMSLRMEAYIRKVLTYTGTKYPGVIYAWDVVNEAADDNGGYRKNSNWYRVMGEGFIEEAFRYARKYAPAGVKLFYNDYNEYYPVKRETIDGWIKDLQGKGLIDGMGMQSHVDLRTTKVDNFLETVEIYGNSGLEVQITELDIHNPDSGVAGQMKLADMYGAIVSGLCELKQSGKANITNLTLWGLSDDGTWLVQNRGEQSYPLLFDGKWQPKEAYRAVIDVKIPGMRQQYQTKR